MTPTETVAPASSGVKASEVKPKPKKIRKVRNKEALAKEIDRQLLENAPEMLRQKWEALGIALGKGERWAVELIARQFEGDRGPGGVNIVSQTLNIAAAEQGNNARSLESIVRRLEAKDQFKALPEPTPIRVGRPDLDESVLDGDG